MFKIFCFIAFSFLQSPIDNVKDKFPNITSNKEATYYLELLENNNDLEAQAYKAGLYFMKSRYVFLPTSKFKYFNKGKEKLDQLISNNTTNIELRYIRLLMQHKVPKFLNYHSNVNEDFEIFIQNFGISTLNLAHKLKLVSTLLLIDNLDEKHKSELINLKASL